MDQTVHVPPNQSEASQPAGTASPMDQTVHIPPNQSEASQPARGTASPGGHTVHNPPDQSEASQPAGTASPGRFIQYIPSGGLNKTFIYDMCTVLFC